MTLSSAYRTEVQTYLAELGPSRGSALVEALPEARGAILDSGALSPKGEAFTAFVERVVASNGVATEGSSGAFQLLHVVAELPAARQIPLGGCNHHTWLLLDAGLKQAALEETCKTNVLRIWNAASGSVRAIEMSPGITVAQGFDTRGELILVVERRGDSKLTTYRLGSTDERLAVLATEPMANVRYSNCRNISASVGGAFYVAAKNDGAGGQVVGVWRDRSWKIDLHEEMYGDCLVTGSDEAPVLVLRAKSTTSSETGSDLRAFRLTSDGFKAFPVANNVLTQDTLILGGSADGGEVYLEHHAFTADTVVREVYALRLADGSRRVLIRKLAVTDGVTTVIAPYAGGPVSLAGEGMLINSSVQGACGHRVSEEWISHRGNGFAVLDGRTGTLEISQASCPVGP